MFGEVDEAHKIYDKILQKSPANTEAILGKGALYLKEGKQKKAIKYFKRILGKLKDKAQSAYLLAQIGVACYDLNKHDKAKTYYEQALNIDSNCHIASYNLGIYYLYKDDKANWGKAIQCFERASHSMEYGHLAHENLVHLFEGLGRYNKALYHLDVLIKLGHFDLAPYYEMIYRPA